MTTLKPIAFFHLATRIWCYMKHTEIEPKWQKLWDEKKAFQAEDIKTSKKQKYYALPMFPYPSGSGLHMGHIAAYSPGDIVSRYKRTQGFNVLHPMGYDAYCSAGKPNAS